MDDNLQELENELKRLPPRRPSDGLWRALERELGHEAGMETVRRYRTATDLSSWKWLSWRNAGLAATLALVAALGVVIFQRPASNGQFPTTPPARLAVSGPAGPTPSVPPASIVRYQPVAAANVLYDLKDEGPAYMDSETPGRRMRYRYLDTYTWKNPRGNASFKWSVPRDEIRVLPVSMN